jgi:predicted NBD/HSP70 family sugar kinase
MIVAIDTGGTKTLFALFSTQGEIVDKVTIPTPKDPAEYTAVVRTTLQERYANRDIKALSIALPGMIKNDIAVWCGNLGWRDFDAKTAFEGTLGNTPIFIENDANLAGLAEARALHPLPNSVLYVTLSTGIGTGVIAHGQIDPTLRQSEGGFVLVEFEGLVKRWEDFASGSAIRKDYGMYARDIRDGAIWEEIADRVSRGFLAIIPLIQPDIIVIGGSIGTYFPKYGAELHHLLRQHLPAHIALPPFIQASHPEEAVIYGCYQYALDHLSR